MDQHPVLLMILDGFGVNPSRLDNGWSQAKTPHLDQYFSHNPHTLLQASGTAVGLPDGQFGNSEVGHLTIGAGRILEQDLLRIAGAIRDGSLEEHPVWQSLLQDAQQNSRRLHLLGLVSDGGVHAHISHLLELLPLIVAAGIEPVIHMITDGRDSPPKSALGYLRTLEEKLDELGTGRVATISGRYWSMDRAGNYDRTEKIWQSLILGKGNTAATATEAIEQAYERGEYDEFINPAIIGDIDSSVIKPDEPVLFFNFRSDRARQLCVALAGDDFEHFTRKGAGVRKLTCLTQYSKAFSFPYIFAPHNPEQVLAEVISNAGFKQFHCAETEKFPHVTYFFNGGHESSFDGEEQLMLPSLAVGTYDEAPEMSTPVVADRLIEAINTERYQFIVTNFANGDMVGHTANMDKICEAIEVMDMQAHRVIEAALAKGFRVMLTSDHGNCDEVVDPVTQEANTQHSVYPVPYLLIGVPDAKLGIGRGLADIAPTVLELLGLSKPFKMTGRSLILKGSLEF